MKLRGAVARSVLFRGLGGLGRLDLAAAFALRAVVAFLGGGNTAAVITGFAIGLGLGTAAGDLVFDDGVFLGLVGSKCDAGDEQTCSDDSDD